MTDKEQPEPSDERPDLEPSALLWSVALTYGLMLLGAVLWLWFRDRLDELPALALGEHGAAGTLGIGLAGALLGSLAMVGFVRWIPGIRRVERLVGRAFVGASDIAIALVSMAAAVAEETFFRCAMQGELGPWLTLCVYTGIHLGPGFWSYWPVALCLGALLGGMVHLGAGLGAAILAHALIHYFAIRRIQQP